MDQGVRSQLYLQTLLCQAQDKLLHDGSRNSPYTTDVMQGQSSATPDLRRLLPLPHHSTTGALTPPSPDYPDRAGYDPALQAMLGYMFLTGEPSRDPMLCGLPLIDLKAGDEAFAQVLLGLLEQKETGKGKRIDISMAQCAASWLITALPQTKFAEDESKLFTRSGNEHRSFVPSNCYPTKDGYVYLAIGSDTQWRKLTQIEGFEHCDKPERETNNGRKEDKENVYADIRKGLENYTTSAFIELCLMDGLAVAPVNNIKQVGEMDMIKSSMVKTMLPNGEEVGLFPAPMDTDFLKNNQNRMELPPRLGEHNKKIFEECGILPK